MIEDIHEGGTAPETMTTKLRVIWGDEGLERIQDSRVAVFGCGGVGSNCIEALARGGVGTIAIVDKDVVAASNINRQAIAFESTVGRRKVDVMAAMIADINPSCHVVARHEFVLAENLEGILGDLERSCGGPLDHIIDAIDTVSTKLALAKLAEERGLPLISSMGAANKLHPECLRLSDVHKTVNCSLSRIMRKECRKRGIRHLKVLYSCEEPMRIKAREGAAREERSDLGTASFMPPIMGQMIAGEVIRQISGVGAQGDVSAALAMHDVAQRGVLGGRKGARR
ncbi:MAG: tRNA threonylcarbamoyladenosine dehydratase [Collinsella sp.]|nr:tRNA threonylcarbamoyladenosine dehydratase [Collinsella sp.]